MICELFSKYFQKQTPVCGWFLWWKEIKFSVRPTNFICSGQWLLRQIWLKWSLLNSANGTFLMISCGYFSWSLEIVPPFWVFVACISFSHLEIIFHFFKKSGLYKHSWLIFLSSSFEIFNFWTDNGRSVDFFNSKNLHLQRNFEEIEKNISFHISKELWINIFCQFHQTREETGLKHLYCIHAK